MSAIFLDIELTLIHSMDNPTETEFAHKIFDFVKNKQNIFIFSWAIHNNTDKFSFFNSPTFKWICSNLNIQIPIEHIITKDSLRDSFSKQIRTLDLNDFHDVCQSKEIAFELFCRFDERCQPFSKFLLIDDTVENKIVNVGNKEIVFLRANKDM
jgi:hypothetical protein